MTEHKTLESDRPISASQLDELARQGWELIQSIPRAGSGYIQYLKRERLDG